MSNLLLSIHCSRRTGERRKNSFLVPATVKLREAESGIDCEMFVKLLPQSEPCETRLLMT